VTGEDAPEDEVSGEPRWLSEAILLAIHARQVERYGGAHGVLDENVVRSALARPRHRWSDDEERTAWFVREGRVVGGGPAQMIGLADRGIVDVVCLQAGQWFVSQRAYAGDFTRPGVVVHELGEFDLVVEVVDSAGRAVGGAEVGVAPAASFATPARNVTGAEGRVTYAVGQDFYDVVVSLSGEETPTRATAYVARDDTLRVELQP